MYGPLGNHLLICVPLLHNDRTHLQEVALVTESSCFLAHLLIYQITSTKQFYCILCNPALQKMQHPTQMIIKRYL